MKSIGITLRVSEVSSYQERRDCIDQRWFKLLLSSGVMPVLIPNNIDLFNVMLDEYKLNGFILTGGNDLQMYGGSVPERDALEYSILTYCIDNEIPVLGVCRGMQVIQNYFGVSLNLIPNHVATYHSIVYESDTTNSQILRNITSVNSFHKFGSYLSNPPLNIVAKSLDGVVMAIEHDSLPIFGHMWHPERDAVFHKSQILFLQQFFGSDLDDQRY